MLHEKSEANLEIAIFCLSKQKESFYSVGVSRAYYAIFQETKNFLVKNSFDYKLFKRNDSIAINQADYAHGSIRSALEYFLRTNGFNSKDDLIFIMRVRSTFYKLYNWRIEGDYNETVITKENLEDAIESAEKFINGLKKYNN